MPLPNFLVVGNLLDIIGDVTAGELDTSALGATEITRAAVVLTPNVPPGNPFVVWDGDLYRVLPVTAQITDEGVLYKGGPVRLLANDAGLNVDGLQWQASISAGGKVLQSFWFDAPVDGGTIDLAAVAPVAGLTVTPDITATINAAVAAAVAGALALKAPLASPTFTGTVAGITKAMVGLGAVDNTADTAKPVSTAQQTALDLKANLASPAFTGTPTGLTKSHVGLGNVDNTADTAKPVSTAQQTAIDVAKDRANHTGTQAASTISDFTEAAQDAVNALLVGVSGVSLSYDDTANTLTITGGGAGGLDAEAVRDAIGVALIGTGLITVTVNDGADTITITTTATANSSDATLLARANHTGEQATSTITGLDTELGLKAPLASPTFTGTVSGVTKAHVGLGNVDNTADTAKPVSTAQQTALDAKAPLASPAFTGTPTGITKTHVGLGNVDNTSDAGKPVSTAQQTALDAKAPLASPAFTGTPTGITKTHVGLGNVDNTADTAKPVSTAQQTALDAKAPLASPAFTGTPTGITKTHVGLGNVDNTADTAKPVSTAQQTALDGKIGTIAITAAETTAGLVAGDIVDKSYRPGHVYRYVTNTTPGTTDATAALAKWLSLGGIYDLDARVDDVFRVTAQLIIKGGTTLRMGSQCVILRDWAGTAGNKDSNACFKNENAPALAGVVIVNPGPWTPSTTDDDIYIEGGRIRPTSSSQIGAGYYLMGTVNLTMRDCVVERTYQDWSFALGGANFSLRGIRVEQNAAVFEDGPHILYGSGVIEADYIHSGDDCFAIGSNWNLPVNGVDIHMGSFHSEKGYAIKVVQNREGSTAGFPAPTALIQNVRFHSGSGKAGVARNGLIQTWADAAGLLADITIDGVYVDADTQTHDAVNPYGVFCKDVTRLKLVNVTAKNARRHAFHIQNCPQAELIGCVAKDSQGTSTYRALEIQDCLDARVVGGEYLRTLTHPINVMGTSSASFQGTLIREIGDNLAGILLANTSHVSAHGVTFRKVSGAALSAGIRTNSTTATVVADGCIWDVDRPFYPATAPAYAQVSKAKRTVTIASDAISTFGDDQIDLLCQGGTADSLATINIGYEGQVLTLLNAEVDPATDTITVKHGTGNIFNASGTDVVMGATANTVLRYVFNGTNWVQDYTDTAAAAGDAAATASTLALRDSNANLKADAFIPSVTSTATAAGTTTLTIDSAQVQVFTGSSTQTCQLPTTSVVAGQTYIVINQSSGGNITVNSSTATFIANVPATTGVGIFIALVNTPTTTAHWQALIPSAVSQLSTIAMRNSNGNILSDAFLPGRLSTATAAGTTTLTIDSVQTQVFTGSTTQTVTLPTSSVLAGYHYTIVNNSSGSVTVQSSGANTISTLTTNTMAVYYALVDGPTTAAHWRAI